MVKHDDTFSYIFALHNIPSKKSQLKPKFAKQVATFRLDLPRPTNFLSTFVRFLLRFFARSSHFPDKTLILTVFFLLRWILFASSNGVYFERSFDKPDAAKLKSSDVRLPHRSRNQASRNASRILRNIPTGRRGIIISFIPASIRSINFFSELSLNLKLTSLRTFAI